jgi:hypothetical protein
MPPPALRYARLMLSGKLRKGGAIGRFNDPKLLLVIGVGIGLLGLLFAGCVNTIGARNTYTRERLFFAGGIDDLFLFGIP